MPPVNASFSSQSRSNHLQALLHQLEPLSQGQRSSSTFTWFDWEIKNLLAKTFGVGPSPGAPYSCALLEQAEDFINFSEADYEPLSHDVARHAVHQRRRVLHGLLLHITQLHNVEEKTLKGKAIRILPTDPRKRNSETELEGKDYRYG